MCHNCRTAPDGTVWHFKDKQGYIPEGERPWHTAAPREYEPRMVRDDRRNRIWWAFGHRCGICGKKIRLVADVTEDHVIPRSKGGKTLRNVVPAHQPCNARKSNRDPTGCELIVLAAVNARLHSD